MMRYLVTTGLPEGMPGSDVPVVFLGEWCKLYKNRLVWSKYDAITLGYHWDDRGRLKDDLIYIDSVYLKVLTGLADQLNKIHGVKKNKRYWEILVGPWLYECVYALYDRWLSINMAIDTCSLCGVSIVSADCFDLTPKTTSHFSRLTVGDNWNSWVYGEILKFLGCETDYHFFSVESDLNKGVVRDVSVKQLVRQFIAKHNRRHDKALLYKTYMPRIDEYRLLGKLRQLPLFDFDYRYESVCSDFKRKQLKLDVINASTAFECFLVSIIGSLLPEVFLDGFSWLSGCVKDLMLPTSPQFVFTANAYYYDEAFKYYAAEMTDKGVPLLIGQHGGFFGIGRWAPQAQRLVAVSDKFISWGWSAADNAKIIPAQKRREAAICCPRPMGSILLVLGAMPRYAAYQPASQPIACQWAAYFDDILTFLSELEASVRSRLIVKLYPTDYGWAQRERISDRFPDVVFAGSTRSARHLMAASSLIINTYNGTGLLEAILMNKPSFIFWNPLYWELSNEAIKLFDELSLAGAFCSGPSDAAKRINVISKCPDSWWLSKQVSLAITNFKRHYFAGQNTLENILLSYVRGVSKKSVMM